MSKDNSPEAALAEKELQKIKLVPGNEETGELAEGSESVEGTDHLGQSAAQMKEPACKRSADGAKSLQADGEEKADSGDKAGAAKQDAGDRAGKSESMDELLSLAADPSAREHDWLAAFKEMNRRRNKSLRTGKKANRAGLIALASLLFLCLLIGGGFYAGRISQPQFPTEDVFKLPPAGAAW